MCSQECIRESMQTHAANFHCFEKFRDACVLRFVDNVLVDFDLAMNIISSAQNVTWNFSTQLKSTVQ